MAEPKHDVQQFKIAFFKAAESDRAESLYKLTSNGLHAWFTYHHARKLGVPIPDWVLDYFDASAERLTSSDSPSTQSAAAVAKALQLHKAGGPTAHSRHRIDWRNAEIIDRMRHLRKSKGGPDDLHFGELAERFGLSIERVRDIFYGWTNEAKKPEQRKSLRGRPQRSR